RCLAFTVDPKHQTAARSPAHVQIEFGEKDLYVFSLFGFTQLSYSQNWNAPFNRTDLIPWWGAWAPAILGLLALVTIVGLLSFWALLACVYCVPVWLIAFFSDRQLSLSGSWRLVGAALMPGALLVTLAVFFYALGTLGLVELFAAWVLHWVIGWVYAW